MSKVMGTTALGALLERIAGEYRAKGSVFDIPERAFREAFELEAGSPGLETLGGRASLPVGPAAGPNSQIAPALVAAYLAGGRVFELKTVQENDALEIDKPCIDVRDEGYNVEWSTELALPDARDEYLRGWIAINLLAALFSAKPRDFVFNMSVGYTLDGIKGAKVDSFIEGMRSPAASPLWKSALRELETFAGSPAFAAAFGLGARSKALGLVADFPDRPVASVTLSTMHGCPPEEIQRIGEYLIAVKGFDAYVKLNPTLLGYDAVRGILDATGWESIRMERSSFEKDLQFARALDLVRALGAKAAAAGRRFGVKLSNTLANRNDGSYLPGAERYMSGRALFPVTVRLAAELAQALPEFADRFSYCGGASALNAAELVAAGLGPITVATDILKPGGYLRLGQAAREAAGAIPGSPGRPDAAALRRLASAALERPEYRSGWKSGEASIDGPLPLSDCFAAPCVEACPVNQRVPEYLRLSARGGGREALASILSDNPLPFITGTLCDHVCQEACCRNDYEGAVEIRAVKLHCAKSATVPASRPPAAAGSGDRAPKAAAVGAGPAGLAFAHHLALAGVPVTVFDASPSPGGVPANVIPRFRIPRADIAADIERIAALGAEFRFGKAVASLAELASQGYTSVFACVGASVPREMPLEGEGVRVVDALAFLSETAGLGSDGSAKDAASERAAAAYRGVRSVVVAGGGNTAMDAARVALRLPGVSSVLVAYRRSRAEMPADAEELANVLAEGGKLRELLLPEKALPATADGGPALVLRIMELGERDASGRRLPVPTDRAETLHCDLLIEAIGESPDRALLESLGIACDGNGRPIVDPATQEAKPLPSPSIRGIALYAGGDAARGPSSIIAAEADGRRAAYAVMRAGGIEPPARDYEAPPPDAEKLAARGLMSPSLPRGDRLFASREAERCLACDSACLRCVEVCPNRANTAIAVGGEPFRQALQILHVDYLCNECGNCGSFCPWEGEPYKGKITLFRDRAALEASRNVGFCLAAGEGGRGAGEPRVAALRAAYGGPVLAGPALPGGPAEGGLAAVLALARAVGRDHAYLLGGAP